MTIGYSLNTIMKERPIAPATYANSLIVMIERQRKSTYWKMNNRFLGMEERKVALNTTLETCQKERDKYTAKAIELQRAILGT